MSPARLLSSMCDCWGSLVMPVCAPHSALLFSTLHTNEDVCVPVCPVRAATAAAVNVQVILPDGPIGCEDGVCWGLVQWTFSPIQHNSMPHSGPLVVMVLLVVCQTDAWPVSSQCNYINTNVYDTGLFRIVSHFITDTSGLILEDLRKLTNHYLIASISIGSMQSMCLIGRQQHYQNQSFSIGQYLDLRWFIQQLCLQFPLHWNSPPSCSPEDFFWGKATGIDWTQHNRSKESYPCVLLLFWLVFPVNENETNFAIRELWRKFIEQMPMTSPHLTFDTCPGLGHFLCDYCF